MARGDADAKLRCHARGFVKFCKLRSRGFAAWRVRVAKGVNFHDVGVEAVRGLDLIEVRVQEEAYAHLRVMQDLRKGAQRIVMKHRVEASLRGELVRALWHDGRGDWDKAHRIAQSVDDAEGAWVHAYLHRKEGDLSNAGYWYSRAGRPRSEVPLDEEWEEIAGTLLG